MTDIADTPIDETEETKVSKSSRRAILGLTGAGIAGAVVMGPKMAQAATGDNAVLGEQNDADQPTEIENTSDPIASQTPGTPGGEAIKGVISGTNNGSHAILGVTEGKGHAVAGVIGTADAPGDNVVAATWGRHYGQGAAIEGDSRTPSSPLAGPANAVKGTIQSADNGSHAINGFTNGIGHAVAGESFNTTADAKAATWGRHIGPAAAVEGISITPTAPIAGPANGVKGIVNEPGNGSHAVLGVTNGGGHAVAGDIPAGTGNTVGATWGRHAGLGAGAEGINTATGVPIAGTANGVKGTVADATNGSHAVLGITNGGGHSVAGDTPADAMGPNGEGPNTTAATWGRHGGVGAGIGGVSAQGYGGEFIGGLASVRLIPSATPPAGAPTSGDHLRGELVVASNGALSYNRADGLSFTKLNDQALIDPAPGVIKMLDEPMRAFDSRADEPPASSAKGKLQDQQTIVVDLTTETDFPAGASAAVLNVTVTETERDPRGGQGGYLTVFSAALADRPGTSTINWGGPNMILSNGATIAVDSGGKIKIFCHSTTHCVIDVMGYVG